VIVYSHKYNKIIDYYPHGIEFIGECVERPDNYEPGEQLPGSGLPPCMEKKKPKLVAMMLTHNETGRYLERVIDNTLSFCDEIVILDDHSTDGTYELIFELWRKYGDRIHCSKAKSSWSNESELRKELLDATYALDPEWIIAVDADELYESDKMKEHLPHIMSQTQADWVGFRFYDMWDDEQHYRDDDIWPAGNSYAPRMFRVKPGMEYEFENVRRHCGSIPANVLRCPGVNSSVRVKHLGWMKPEDRDKKYLDRITDDPNNEFFPQEVYDAILDEHPKLVEWDDDNPWQTGKLTIAYPPGMEWNIMQQRPHHLLKLAASERYRVFFGDDTAPGTYEPTPYLTVIQDWESIKEVDILYVTDPIQMGYCKHIKYKKLIYDCCDWQLERDYDLIRIADYVLCASKILFDRILSLTSTEYSNTKNIIYLPNACEYDHFARTPDPLPDAPEPIIGYMGCIHPAMIDEKIINALAEKYRILVIGQNKGVEFTHPNIFEAGHVPYTMLPSYLTNCMVGIIPFRTDSDYLRYSAPIKVYEYLSAGRPVVASPIPELLPLADKGIIRVVENDDLDGWVEAVTEAIKDYPNKQAQKWASDQTWRKRWNTLKKEALELE
jgi:glycosyltransferase involved in cell wall biosynthesis